MQLNNLKLNISFLCAFAPLRLGGIKFVRLCEQNNHKNEKNMKKQQKTDYFENTRKPSLFSGEPANSLPLLEKTNPILTPQISLQPLILQLVTTISFKIPQKKRTQLKPIKANLQHLFRGENLFKNTLPIITEEKCLSGINFRTQKKSTAFNSCALYRESY